MYKHKCRRKVAHSLGEKNKYTNVRYCTTHSFADRLSNLKIRTIRSKTITANNPSEEMDPKLYSAQRETRKESKQHVNQKKNKDDLIGLITH